MVSWWLKRWWYVAAVVACALGMGSKEVMVTAPALVLLYDRVFLAQSWREVGRRRGRMYAGLSATWLLLPLVLGNGQGEWKETAGLAFTGITPAHYALAQLAVDGAMRERAAALGAKLQAENGVQHAAGLVERLR